MRIPVYVCVVERCALFSISFSSLGQKNKNEDSQKNVKKKQTKIQAGQVNKLISSHVVVVLFSASA